MISAYHKKGNTIEDKLEIFKEIQKFDCDRATQFFYKLNDSERNNQIRNMAFQHLQNTGHYVKLRKNFKGKKKIYMEDYVYTFLKKIARNPHGDEVAAI